MTTMEGRTTIDYNSLLKNWKTYQKLKFENQIKMANAFLCNLYSQDVTMLGATLSFILEGEHRLEVRRNDLFITIMLRNIQGYSIERQNIQLTRRPEQGIRFPPIILEFPTEAICAVVFAQLENFTREIVFEPTPPSSSESDD